MRADNIVNPALNSALTYLKSSQTKVATKKAVEAARIAGPDVIVSDEVEFLKKAYIRAQNTLRNLAEKIEKDKLKSSVNKEKPLTLEDAFRKTYNNKIKNMMNPFKVKFDYNPKAEATGIYKSAAKDIMTENRILPYETAIDGVLTPQKLIETAIQKKQHQINTLQKITKRTPQKINNYAESIDEARTKVYIDAGYLPTEEEVLNVIKKAESKVQGLPEKDAQIIQFPDRKPTFVKIDPIVKLFGGTKPIDLKQYAKAHQSEITEKLNEKTNAVVENALEKHFKGYERMQNCDPNFPPFRRSANAEIRRQAAKFQLGLIDIHSKVESRIENFKAELGFLKAAGELAKK
ncbi:MAG TPA: hypothetical protein P5556_07145 [Candidatus Gastranaerophilales bacterium]|nr:hypothetical protein [Candidatus Gastranaerophilales bacterium]